MENASVMVEVKNNPEKVAEGRELLTNLLGSLNSGRENLTNRVNGLTPEQPVQELSSAVEQMNHRERPSDGEIDERYEKFTSESDLVEAKRKKTELLDDGVTQLVNVHNGYDTVQILSIISSNESLRDLAAGSNLVQETENDGASILSNLQTLSDNLDGFIKDKFNIKD